MYRRRSVLFPQQQCSPPHLACTLVRPLLYIDHTIEKASSVRDGATTKLRERYCAPHQEDSVYFLIRCIVLLPLLLLPRVCSTRLLLLLEIWVLVGFLVCSCSGNVEVASTECIVPSHLRFAMGRAICPRTRLCHRNYVQVVTISIRSPRVNPRRFRIGISA